MNGRYNEQLTGNNQKCLNSWNNSIRAFLMTPRGTTLANANDIQSGRNKALHECPTMVESWVYWDSDDSVFRSAGRDLHLKCAGNASSFFNIYTYFLLVLDPFFYNRSEYQHHHLQQLYRWVRQGYKRIHLHKGNIKGRVWGCRETTGPSWHWGWWRDCFWLASVLLLLRPRQ